VELDVHATLLAVCRLPPDSGIPRWVGLASQPLVSITRTASELSIVLPQADVPPEVRSEAGWRAMSVCGPLHFSLTGILASLCGPLAAAGVPVFVISTYDTDWLLIADDRSGDAIAALEEAGHRVHRAAEPVDEASD
jgi:uncharacterized protein